MFTILVTGGAGFIGSHTAKALLDKGHKIVIVDNFNDYYDPQLKHDRLKYLIGDHPNLKVIEADVSDYASLEKIFQTHQFDKICHLAAYAGVRYSLENPFVFERSNLLGFLNILELCRNFKVQNLIYASSSSVYGDHGPTKFKETDLVDHPISFYAATKKSNELMAYTYHHLFGIKCTGLRFFTVYGPWGRPDMAMLLFIKQALDNQPINVYNQGQINRDFTYIDDIVNGIVAALEYCYDCEIFNLARGETVKLLDCIIEIEKNLNLKVQKKLMPMQPGDVFTTAADISKAQKMLNYSPQVSIPEGIKRLVEWYKNYYS